MLDRGKFFLNINDSLYKSLLKSCLSAQDGDGRISWEELGYVMKTLGHRVSENQLKEIMKLIDENGKIADGKLFSFLFYFVYLIFYFYLRKWGD